MSDNSTGLVVTRRQAQKLHTRQRLIEAARDRFGQDGILTTRTVDVARDAGVSHGSVFAHFPTRDHLVAATIQAFAGEVLPRIHLLVEQEASVREVLAAHLDGIAAHEAFYARLVMEGPLLPPVARATLLGIQSALAFHLAGATEREAAAGRIRALPLPLLFNTWLGLIHHYLGNRDLFAPGHSVVERHGSMLLDHFVGLLAP